MQRQTLATVYALLAVCAVGLSATPATAQTTTQLERDVREELRRERALLADAERMPTPSAPCSHDWKATWRAPVRHPGERCVSA